MRKLTFNDPQHTFQLRLLGAGGNGSYLFRSLLQMIAGYRNSDAADAFDVGIADGDKVEEKNLRNQLFCDDDIKDYKTSALIERYGEHYNIDVRDYREYITSIDQLFSMFAKPASSKTVPVLIGALDNSRTRQLIHHFFCDERVQDLIWIDLGIEDTVSIKSPTPKELEIMQATGFSGQCVVGVKWKGEKIVPPVTEVYSNILEAEDVFPGMSCGDVLPSNPQRMITNQTAAHVASMILNTLFYTKSIMVSEINFNAQLGHIKPNYITKEQYDCFEALKAENN